jgi:hypothetical protein
MIDGIGTNVYSYKTVTTNGTPGAALCLFSLVASDGALNSKTRE